MAQLLQQQPTRSLLAAWWWAAAALAIMPCPAISSSSAATVTAPSSVPPHIFVYFADDAGYNDFGFTRGLLAPETEFVGPQAKTPEIDALAKGGIVLKSSYAYRYCSPSRGSFL